MSHYHPVVDSDTNFVVNAATRKMTTTSATNLVQYDHNSQRITFELPRYIDGHDMSVCNVVQVHYQNISSNKRNQSSGIYDVDDLAVSTADDEVVTCSWLVSQNATQYAGALNFVVRFACLTGEAVDYAWNTGVYSGLVVSAGMNNTDIVIQDYPDILASHERRLEELEKGGASFSPTTAVTVKKGLTVAIIGDSISTHPKKNVPEIHIQQADVGVELSSYITTYDVGTTISLNGETSDYTITADDVGTELTFTPCSADVDKKLGTPLNYNSITGVWWQVAADALGFEPIAACWSGSSITSHTAGSAAKAASYAWHDHTIRTLGKRVPGSMTRIAPDVVLIYRGTNDLSHSTKVRLTDGYFDPVDWTYPETDVLGETSTYGFKEGLALTIRKIREVYPKTHIVLCTCNVFKRSQCTHFPTHNGHFSIPQMNNAIREVADFFGCHVIELDKCGITFENCYESGYITDSATTPTHPNAKGHALMGKQAISDLIHKLHICDIEPIAPVTDTDDDDTSDSGSTGSGEVSSYIVEGIAINGSTGESFSGSSYYSLMSYPVKPGVTYAIPYGRNYGIFDETDALLKAGMGGGKSDLQLTMPENAAWIDICFKYDDLAPAQVTITEVEADSGSGDESGSGSGTGGSTDTGGNDTGGNETLPPYIVDPWACWENGKESATSGYFAFVDYPVEGGATYSIPYGRNYFFENADHIYLSGGAGAGNPALEVVAPKTAAYITVCFKPSEIAIKDASITKISSVSAPQTAIGDLTGTLMEGYYVASTTTGAISGTSSNTTYYSYADIAVEANTTYNAPYARNTAYYRADGTYISGATGGGGVAATLTTPAEAALMMVTYKYVDLAPAEVTITKA